MKKHGLRVIPLILILPLIFVLCSCGKYTSSYCAIGLVTMQSSHSFETSFYSLKGQKVFKIRKPQKGTDGDISYSISVKEGEIRLYYDIYGVKEQLAVVAAGQSVEASGGYVEGGKLVYVIIEAAENTRGKVSVELDN